MLTDDEGIRSGAIWGLGFMAAVIIFLLVLVIDDSSSSSLTRVFVTEIGYFLLLLTAIMHIRGFVYLGSKLDSSFLRWCSIGLCTVLGLFGFMALALFPIKAYPPVVVQAFVSGVVWVAGLSFMIALWRLYKRLGIVTFPASLHILWLYLIWSPLTPLSALLLLGPSTYLLYRESNT